METSEGSRNQSTELRIFKSIKRQRLLADQFHKGILIYFATGIDWFIRNVPAGSQEGLCLVQRDTGQPGAEAGIESKFREIEKGFEKRFLNDVFRVRLISHDNQ